MDLTHHFLLSMPTLANSWFDKSITYIFEHSDSGAIGFVINRHTDMVAGDIYDQLKVECADKPLRSAPVFQGGPVDGERGFILCGRSIPPDEMLKNALPEDDTLSEPALDTEDHFNFNKQGIGVSSSLEMLTDLSAGKGPTPSLLLLGYAGWAAGQLESEIANNSWLTCEATEDIIFHKDSDAKFEMAAKSLGVDFTLLSSDTGHA